MKRRLGPARPPVEPFPAPEEDWDEYGEVGTVGSITQLTEKAVRGKTKARKHPLGFYEHQTKEKDESA